MIGVTVPSPNWLTFTHIFLHQRGVPVKSSGKLPASQKMPLDDRVSATLWVRVSSKLERVRVTAIKVSRVPCHFEGCSEKSFAGGRRRYLLATTLVEMTMAYLNGSEG